MWIQTLFSKKNRNLQVGFEGFQDEFHILTDRRPHAVDSALSISLASKRHDSPDIMLFIEKIDGKVYCGAVGDTAHVLGPEHPFAREADLNRSGKPGRFLTFTHAYDHAAGSGLRIPGIGELRERQSADLLHILTEAHSGNEPVEVGAVTFGGAREAGTAWDEIAGEVEAGRCRGGFFTKDGALLERFDAVKEVAGAAQKKTVEAPILPQCLKISRPSFLAVTGIAAGVGLAGWAAWELLHRHDDKLGRQKQSTASRQ